MSKRTSLAAILSVCVVLTLAARVKRVMFESDPPPVVVVESDIGAASLVMTPATVNLPPLAPGTSYDNVDLELGQTHFGNYRVTSPATGHVTGFFAKPDGTMVQWCNANAAGSGFLQIFDHQSASSTAARRLTIGGGVTTTLLPGDCMWWTYFATGTAWVAQAKSTALSQTGAVSQSNAGTELDPMFPLTFFPTITSLGAAPHWYTSDPTDPDDQYILGMATTTTDPAPGSTQRRIGVVLGYNLSTAGEGRGTGRYAKMQYQAPNNADSSADVLLISGGRATGSTMLLTAPGPHTGNGRYGHITFETCPGGCGLSSFTRALDNGADLSFLLMNDGQGGSTLVGGVYNKMSCVFDGDATNPKCTVNITVHANVCTCTVRGTTSAATIETCGLSDITLGGPSTMIAYSSVPLSTRTANVTCN